MSSLKNAEELPPPYDQATTIDIDNGTAPLLRETFAGSIFGTSTIVKFQLGSSPEYVPVYCSYFNRLSDYTFVIRDFLECVQANGKVANTSDDLHTTLEDVRGTEIFQFRKRVRDSIEPTSVVANFLAILFDKKRPNINHTFEVMSNGQLIGLVNYVDKEPPETGLRVSIGNGDSELVVKAVSTGEIVIFRDQSSLGPLCNVIMAPSSFSGRIVFHPETGITTDEQLLCTAAAFAVATCCTKQRTIDVNQFTIRMIFWSLFGFVAGMSVIYLIMWLGLLIIRA